MAKYLQTYIIVRIGRRFNACINQVLMTFTYSFYYVHVIFVDPAERCTL